MPVDYVPIDDEALETVKAIPKEQWRGICELFSVPERLARKHGISLRSARALVHQNLLRRWASETLVFGRDLAPGETVPQPSPLDRIEAWGFIGDIGEGE